MTQFSFLLFIIDAKLQSTLVAFHLISVLFFLPECGALKFNENPNKMYIICSIIYGPSENSSLKTFLSSDSSRRQSERIT